MADSLPQVEPPLGIESLHEMALEAESEWAILGFGGIDRLSSAGLDFSIGRDLAVHPELGVIEDAVEDALFGEDAADNTNQKPISAPKPKKKKKRK